MRRLLALGLAGMLGLLLGLAAGADGWSLHPAAWAQDSALILELRLPRSLSAWLAGASLGLAGAIAQGLFRNPLADPFLLGSAAGAHLGVSLSLVIGAGLLGIPLAAFLGALSGVLLSMTLAGSLRQSTHLLLAGVVTGMLMGAAAEMLALLHPDILRARQAFLLGTTAFADVHSVALLGAALATSVVIALPCARILDALTLGEEATSTLGLPLSFGRIALLTALALATGTAVSQLGLVGFIGLAAPHLARALGPMGHQALMVNAALCGGALLALADALCRGVAAPMEWPVGLMTSTLGGLYLLALIRRRGRRAGGGLA